MTTSIYPKQKLSSKEKTKRASKDNKTWGETNVDYFVEQTAINSDHEETLRLYRVLGEELNQEDYNYVLNPFNTEVEQYTRFSARLRNFDIITPIVELYVGEFGKRLKNYQVVATNPDAASKYEKELGQVLKMYYTQASINGLNEAGVETGQESVEQPPVEEVVNKFDRTYTENHVITGNEILDYIVYAEDLDEKYILMYYDWLIVGKTISYKDVNFNDVNLEWVDPLQCYFPKLLTNTPFIEDGDWFVRRQSVTPNYVIDKFHDRLSEEDVEWLDKQNNRKDYQLQNPSFRWMPTAYIGCEADKKKYSLHENMFGLTLYHVQWRSFQEVGILYKENEIGEIDEIEVDDTYKLNKEAGDIKIEWEWITEVWEGWKAKGSDGIELYLDIRPLPYNRADLNNESEQKLSYNGRYTVDKEGNIISVVKKGYTYQILYNVVHYQMERLINRNMDKITVLPIGLLPKDKEGWDEEKAMYYAKSSGFLFIDESSPTASLALQGIKVLDMSLNNYIQQSRDLLQGIKSDWWEAIGMNRQRFGDTNSSDGKGVNEQAIYRSAIISEELNRKFEKFQEKDYSGLIDLSKIAFLDGKKAKYVNSEEREAFLEMNADGVIWHANTSYGVFVKNSIRENQKMEELKGYMFSYAQNAGNSSVFMEALDMANYTKGKEIIRKMEANERALNEDLQRKELESNQNIAAEERQSEQADRDIKVYEADMKYRTVIDGKEIDADKQGTNDNDDTSTVDPVQDREQNRKDKELNHKIKNDNQKLGLDKEKLGIKRKKAASAVQKTKVNN